MSAHNNHTATAETDEQPLLLSLSKDITSCRSREDVQRIASNRLAKYLQFTEMMVCLNSADNLTHSAYIHTVSEKTMSHPDFARGASMKYFVNDGIFNIIEGSEDPVIFEMEELVGRINKPFYVDFWHQNDVKEIIGFPIRTNNECVGALTLYPKKKNLFTTAQLRLLQAVSSFIGIALSNIISFEKIQSQLEEIKTYKSQLERENQYLQEQIRTTYNYEEIVGSDNGLLEVFQLVSNVASSTSTVLILGETGTGKELIARAIHNSSPRRDKLMIKINCAALPSNLIESELFGHERGSFTGATERRIGKFEMASGSTLFLDEIGEMPPELQVKLLRAIQEKEIERIGGKTVIRTNVRIIAATNRNLKQEIETGKFRSDLFYRLNVFPITLPSLRERKEDIPALVSHFVNRYARRSGKEIANVAPRPIREMMLYDWPGNVRELEHVIERSVLMTTGPIIKEIHLPKMDKRVLFSPGEEPLKSRRQNERDHIIAALKKSMGKVGGPGGAAEMLNMPSTTLHSRIKRLGIKKEYE
jgi:transcriptional regulator with GAF, ATPase, and Fis domain